MAEVPVNPSGNEENLLVGKEVIPAGLVAVRATLLAQATARRENREGPAALEVSDIAERLADDPIGLADYAAALEEFRTTHKTESSAPSLPPETPPTLGRFYTPALGMGRALAIISGRSARKP